MRERVARLTSVIGQLSWGGLVLSLPITSLPLLKRLLHADMVSAAAGIFLLLMAAGWFLPAMLRRGTLPVFTRPVLGFLLVALVSSATAFYLETPSLKDRTVADQVVQGLFTLLVGVGFYLVATAWVDGEEKLKRTFQFINIGGAIMVAYSLLQAVYWFGLHAYPHWMVVIQKALVIHKLYAGRVSGFAYEPSWLAHVLNMIYLPYWTAAVLLRTSAFKWRKGWLSVELALLLGGWLALFWSFSRVGLMAYAFMLLPLLVYGNIQLIRLMQRWVSKKLRVSERFAKLIRTFVYGGLVLIIILVYLAAAVGFVYLASRFDFRLARLFDFNSLKKDSFLQLANYLVFAERIIYWETAYRIFGDFPVLGVGIGNSGFFFESRLPAFAWSLPEIHQIFYWANYLPNPKALWMRILAETGAVGFAFFAAWLYMLFQGARVLIRSAGGYLRTAGLMGLLVLTGILIEGFSVDTFALPYFWVSFGILSAAAALFIRNQNTSH